MTSLPVRLLSCTLSLSWFQDSHMILNTILHVYYRASFNCTFMICCMRNQVWFNKMIWFDLICYHSRRICAPLWNTSNAKGRPMSTTQTSNIQISGPWTKTDNSEQTIKAGPNTNISSLHDWLKVRSSGGSTSIRFRRLLLYLCANGAQLCRRHGTASHPPWRIITIDQ